MLHIVECVIERVADNERAIERAHRNLVKPGVRENAADTAGIGEGKGAGILRSKLRLRRQVIARGRGGDGHPFVLAWVAPTGKGETAARLQAPAQVGEGGIGVGEKHDAEA